MAKLTELKALFKKGDLDRFEIDQDIDGQYMVFAFSRKGNEWLGLEDKSGYRCFPECDEAKKAAKSIGFKGE